VKWLGAIGIVALAVATVFCVAKMIEADQNDLANWEKACSDLGGEITSETHEEWVWGGRTPMRMDRIIRHCIVQGQVVSTIG